jgi:hypothetical protein
MNYKFYGANSAIFYFTRLSVMTMRASRSVKEALEIAGLRTEENFGELSKSSLACPRWLGPSEKGRNASEPAMMAGQTVRLMRG